jgi:hypothetical protein
VLLPYCWQPDPTEGLEAYTKVADWQTSSVARGVRQCGRHATRDQGCRLANLDWRTVTPQRTCNERAQAVVEADSRYLTGQRPSPHGPPVRHDAVGVLLTKGWESHCSPTHHSPLQKYQVARMQQSAAFYCVHIWQAAGGHSWVTSLRTSLGSISLYEPAGSTTTLTHPARTAPASTRATVCWPLERCTTTCQEGGREARNLHVHSWPGGPGQSGYIHSEANSTACRPGRQPSLAHQPSQPLRQSLPQPLRQSLPQPLRKSLPQPLRQSLPQPLRKSLPQSLCVSGTLYSADETLLCRTP